MKLIEAQENIGARVVYAPPFGQREDGTIVRVSAQYVFVRYGLDSVKATHPDDLYLMMK